MDKSARTLLKRLDIHMDFLFGISLSFRANGAPYASSVDKTVFCLKLGLQRIRFGCGKAKWKGTGMKSSSMIFMWIWKGSVCLSAGWLVVGFAVRANGGGANGAGDTSIRDSLVH